MRQINQKQYLLEAKDLLEVLDFIIDSGESNPVLNASFPLKGMRATISQIRRNISFAVEAFNSPNLQQDLTEQIKPQFDMSRDYSKVSSETNLTTSPLAGRIKRIPQQVSRVREIGIDDVDIETQRHWTELDENSARRQVGEK